MEHGVLNRETVKLGMLALPEALRVGRSEVVGSLKVRVKAGRPLLDELVVMVEDGLEDVGVLVSWQ
jgi:hypothetical protein